MAVRSTTVALAGSPALLVSGDGNGANVPRKVAIVPSAAITIGGPDEQTFPVTTAGITLDLVAGDDVWGDGTADVEILEAGV